MARRASPPLRESASRWKSWRAKAGPGGGALPCLPCPAGPLTLAVRPLAAQELEARLRQAGTPVIGRVEHGVVVLDVRTLLPGDEAAIMTALEEVLADLP